jgi:hypothetical protein
MKCISPITEDAVFGAWRALNKVSTLDPTIIDHNFPKSVSWCTARIESHDIAHLLLIHVPDLGPLSNNSWTLSIAAELYGESIAQHKPYDPEHAKRMESLLEWPHRFDHPAILVSDNTAGPFVILDGNHRLMLLAHETRIIGAQVYLGVDRRMRQCSRFCPEVY